MKIDLETDFELRSSLNHIKRYMVTPNGLFLEVGCGLAKNACLLAKERIKVVGIDISLNAVKGARRLFEKEKVRGWFVCGDMLNMPFRDNVFSFMYAGGAIEHFKNTLTAVSELKRCLKNGGIISATIPYISLSLPYLMLRGNIPDIVLLKPFLEFFHFRLMKGKLMKFGYEKSFTLRKILRVFKEAGFTKLRTGLFETYYPLRPFRYEIVKKFLTKIAQRRPFWPMVYVNSKK